MRRLTSEDSNTFCNGRYIHYTLYKNVLISFAKAVYMATEKSSKRSTSVGDLLSKMKRKNGQMNKRTHVFNPKSINPEKNEQESEKKFQAGRRSKSSDTFTIGTCTSSMTGLFCGSQRPNSLTFHSQSIRWTA